MGDDFDRDLDTWNRIVALLKEDLSVYGPVHPSWRFRCRWMSLNELLVLNQFEYGTPEWEFTWEML